MPYSRRVSLLKSIDSPGTPASDALQSKTDVPAGIAEWNFPWSYSRFQDDVSLKAADRKASQSAMKNRGTENSVCLTMRKKTRKFVFLTALAAGSLLLGKPSHALSGDAAEESGGRGSSREARRGAPPLQYLSPAPALHGRFLSPAMMRTEVTRRLRANSWVRSSQMS